MGTAFLTCAIVGGTVLLCQFVLTLIGLGGHDADFGHDLSGGDVGAGEMGGHTDVHLEGHPVGDGQGHDAQGHHGSSWLFGVVSFRTVVAAITFFGLTGLTARSSGATTTMQLLVAITGGAAAMLVVHAVMKMFFRLSEDGTVRIQRAIGKEATVYIPIPAGKSGVGKVQISLQDRLMEYAAVTSSSETLETGARVIVVAVRGPNTLEVEQTSAKG